ncbi:SulP family inorganic anion transporter [Acinetobacter pittii]|uniref:SulP family inorganic anion transporter n=1 Tax=Acinetobacter haemolyticus TaxID=29430 RepID=A0AAW4J2R9_ACIHA|nr:MULTISPECIES: SulP family inorganic anion transporter [Acinetobacter]MBN6533008.1 SulP family inorganic anion transporter [Acinetobacter pittii]MBO3656933.1 SulP family inorganic anion transporter [Acinetobacter haemolyticus]
MFSNVREQWFSNIRGDVLAGLVVGLALIPEAIAFSIIAGVDPKIGLYASFCIAVVISFVGGRPGMISAATGAMALLMVTLVKEHGLEYLLAATILTGVIQIIAGYLKLAKLMRFVSKSVVIGFVNALAILIFMAQLPELINVTWYVYALVAFGLAIIYLFPLLPKIGKLIPSPLMCIIIITLIAISFGIDVRTVGDMGQLPDTLPVFLLPDIPLNLETLTIILPYSIALAAVGLLESMMTATIVDEMTDTPSDKFQECKGQGIANIASGFMGGMAGCAMIGQSMINVKSGGLTRLSTFSAGVFLLILVVFISDWLRVIPMAALVAVMIMVSISTFEWKSLTSFKENPQSSNIVMIATVIVVVATHNLALGVLTGVLLSALFLANKLENDIRVERHLEGSTRVYALKGQIFFSSAEKFMQGFDFKENINDVIIDLTHSHIWDVTSVAMLDSVVNKFQRNGVQVSVRGLNEASSIMIDKYGTHAKI